MEKSIKYLSVLLVAIFFGVGGCTSILDKAPSGNLTSIDRVFSKDQTTISYLNSVYSYIPKFGDYYYLWTMLAGLTDDGDDTDFNQAPTYTSTQWYEGQLTPTNNPLNHSGAYNHYFYNNWWQGIRKANVFLANIDDATLNSEHEIFRSRYKAEARLLRAFYYLNLIKEYGPMPIRKKPFSEVFDYKKLTRPSFDKVVQFIVDQCNMVIDKSNGLPWRITNSNNANRFTKAVAVAIESEATLFNASLLWNPENDISKWKQAAKVSGNALDSLKKHGYELYPNYSDYYLRAQDFSSSPSDQETILQVNGLKWPKWVNGIPIEGYSIYKAGVTPSQELVDSYDMKNTGQPPILGYKGPDHLHPIINSKSGYNPKYPYENRDPRFYATVWYNQAPFPNIKGKSEYKLQIYNGGNQQIDNSSRRHTHNGYYLRKYNDPMVRKNEGNSSTWKIFQLSVIYLNYAEAANEAHGPTTEVYDAINTIRDRVNMPNLPSGLSQTEMRKRIRSERRVELAFGGHRFWDVRRWKILNKTGKLTTGMKWDKHSNGTFTHERFVVDHRHSWEKKYLIFPIPADELSKLGPNFKQNPGW